MQTCRLPHERDSRSVLPTGQARTHSRRRPASLPTQVIRRHPYDGPMSRRFQGRELWKNLVAPIEYSLFGFGNSGVSKVRRPASNRDGRTDVRLACHSEPTPLRHGRMPSVFWLVPTLPSPRVTGRTDGMESHLRGNAYGFVNTEMRTLEHGDMPFLIFFISILTNKTLV